MVKGFFLSSRNAYKRKFWDTLKEVDHSKIRAQVKAVFAAADTAALLAAVPANQRGKTGLITLPVYAAAQLAQLASVNDLLEQDDEEVEVDEAAGAQTRKRARTTSGSSSSSSSSSAAAPKTTHTQMFRFMDGLQALKRTLTDEMREVFDRLISSDWMAESFKKEVLRDDKFSAVREQADVVGLLEIIKELATKGSTDSQDTIALDAILNYRQVNGQSNHDYASEHASLVSAAKLAGVDPTVGVVKNQITQHLKVNVNEASKKIIQDHLVKCAMDGTPEPDYEGYLKRLVAVERALAATSSSSSSSSSSNSAFVADEDNPKGKRKQERRGQGGDSGRGQGSDAGRGQGAQRGRGQPQQRPR